MRSAFWVLPSSAVVLCLFGCGKSSGIDIPDLVPSGEAPKQVDLTKIPPVGSKHTLKMQVEEREVDTGKTLLFSATEVEQMVDVQPDLVTSESHMESAKILHDDFRVNEAKLIAGVNADHHKLQFNKQGDYVSGELGKLQPTSYHFPSRPISTGNQWQGWKGVGKSKQVVLFNVDRLMKSKGHDIAQISYQYNNRRGEVVLVKEWFDATSGWMVRSDETFAISSRKKPATMTVREIDTAFE